MCDLPLAEIKRNTPFGDFIVDRVDTCTRCLPMIGRRRLFFLFLALGAISWAVLWIAPGNEYEWVRDDPVIGNPATQLPVDEGAPAVIGILSVPVILIALVIFASLPWPAAWSSWAQPPSGYPVEGRGPGQVVAVVEGASGLYPERREIPRSADPAL